MEILRLGGAYGMAREERLFLTKNTLLLFDRLFEITSADYEYTLLFSQRNAVSSMNEIYPLE